MDALPNESSRMLVATCGPPTSSNAMLAIADAMAARGGKEVVAPSNVVLSLVTFLIRIHRVEITLGLAA